MSSYPDTSPDPDCLFAVSNFAALTLRSRLLVTVSGSLALPPDPDCLFDVSSYPAPPPDPGCWFAVSSYPVTSLDPDCCLLYLSCHCPDPDYLSALSSYF